MAVANAAATLPTNTPQDDQAQMSKPPPIIQQIFTEYDRISLEGYLKVAAETKADGSIITQVDRESSRMVLDGLIHHYPDYGVISEEEPIPYLPEARFKWVVDPLDGTAMYSRGFPVWGMGIGLMDGILPVAGFMRFPALGETYTYWESRMELNRVELNPVRPPVWPDNTNLMIGSKLHKQMSLNRLSPYKLRDFGSTLYHVLVVALGKAEAVITPACSLWDLAAALPFTRSRGMVERHLNGHSLDLDALVSNPNGGYKLKLPVVIGYPDEVDRVLNLLAG